MGQNVSPIDFETAVEKQLELWNKSRELANREGEVVYSRTETPVIATDEVIGSHEFDEVKAERERRADEERPERVQKVAAVNEITGKVLSGDSFDSFEEVWRDLVNRGSGIYRGLHPTMKREGAFIYGCPHLLVFEDERPVQVVRLRGTKYVERTEPYPSQLVGPWLTCRILERSQFDVGDLSFTLIRYDRRKHPDEDRVKILSQVQHAFAAGETVQNIEVEEAIDAFPDLKVDTYDYNAQFTHESTDFAERLRRSIAILRGEREPAGRTVF